MLALAMMQLPGDNGSIQCGVRISSQLYQQWNSVECWIVGMSKVMLTKAMREDRCSKHYAVHFRLSIKAGSNVENQQVSRQKAPLPVVSKCLVAWSHQAL